MSIAPQPSHVANSMRFFERSHPACAHRGIGAVQRIRSERSRDPHADDGDACLARGVSPAAQLIFGGIDVDVIAHAQFDAFEPGIFGAAELLVQRHFARKDHCRDALAELRRAGGGRAIRPRMRRRLP